MELSRIRVAGEAPYDVVVGTELLGELPELVAGARQVLVVHADPVAGVGDLARSVLRDAGVEAHAWAVPGGEPDKSIRSVESLWDALGRAEFARSDAMVAIGGGATTDLVGFVAATWLRGVRVVHVPTTLLGMVDAAVGGKTGINTAAGKNLVGAFHPPAGVLCDLSALATLPAAELRSGLAEVVKAGFIGDPVLLDLVEAGVERNLGELVERAVRVKATVVSADLRERGGREVLNYGHTLGHAIERVEDYRWRHGDAVSVGMVFAAALGRLAGSLDTAVADRHRAILERLGLPTAYPGAAWPALTQAMRVDKKSRGGRLRFVVLAGLARPELLDDPPPDLLTAAYSEVAS